MLNGLLGRKIGMTQIFAENGDAIPVTLLELGPVTVIQKKTQETDGYDSVQVGFQDIETRKINAPMKGHFKDQAPKRFLKEFKVDDISKIEVGQNIDASIFSENEIVAITGKSKGRGFSGVIRRHNFAGQPASHGHRGHRLPGSIGQRTFPGRVFKGKKMPGQYGNKKITTQGIKIVKVDVEKNLVLVKGPVPGANGGLVSVTKMPR